MPQSEREQSPSKNVHFGRRLEKGPTGNQRASTSPQRSALHRPNDMGDNHVPEREDARAGQGRKRATSHSIQEKDVSPAKRRNIPKEPVAAQSKASLKRQERERDADIQPPDGKRKPLREDGKTDEPHARHVQICRDVHNLKSAIKTFAEHFQEAPSYGSNAQLLRSLLKGNNEQLIRYIGCLALGGNNTAEEWETLLREEESRQAIVYGIVGRALKEHVFGQLCFGADRTLSDELGKLEQDGFQQDGKFIESFYRTRQRADAILSSKDNQSLKTEACHKAAAELVLQLEYMLRPLWDHASSPDAWDGGPMMKKLNDIVQQALHLSRKMRTDADTVYYWPPTMKDEEFEPERMECLNLTSMWKDSPYVAKKIDGVDRSILQPGNADRKEAVVQVVCFPGLVAYRQGGGDFVSAADRKKGDQGFRTAVISKSVVMLQWGKQRVLTREAGTSAHIQATKKGDMSRYENKEERFTGLYDLYLQWKGGKDVFSPAPPQSSFFLPSLSRSLSRSPTS